MGGLCHLGFRGGVSNPTRITGRGFLRSTFPVSPRFPLKRHLIGLCVRRSTYELREFRTPIIHRKCTTLVSPRDGYTRRRGLELGTPKYSFFQFSWGQLSVKCFVDWVQGVLTVLLLRLLDNQGSPDPSVRPRYITPQDYLFFIEFDSFRLISHSKGILIT